MINMGIYYMTYVLKNENLYGVFSWAINIPLIIALVFTPALVARWKGMYKLNLRGYMLGTLGRALVIVAGYLQSVPLMLLFTAVYKHRRSSGNTYWKLKALRHQLTRISLIILFSLTRLHSAHPLTTLSRTEQILYSQPDQSPHRV